MYVMTSVVPLQITLSFGYYKLRTWTSRSKNSNETILYSYYLMKASSVSSSKSNDTWRTCMTLLSPKQMLICFRLPLPLNCPSHSLSEDYQGILTCPVMFVSVIPPSKITAPVCILPYIYDRRLILKIQKLEIKIYSLSSSPDNG